jgi:hypothetical protein
LLVSAGALIRVHSPGVIDEHPAHHPRCQCKKMRTALPVHLARACQLKKCLMHQNSGLERVILPLMPHVFRSDNVEFLIDEWYEIGRGVGIAYPHPLQKQRHIMFRDLSARGHIGARPIFKFGKSVLLPRFRTGCSFICACPVARFLLVFALVSKTDGSHNHCRKGDTIMNRISLKSMLTPSVLAVALTLSSFAPGPRASAQTPTLHVVADIPFDFRSGSEMMPAGKYDIQTLSSHILILRGTTQNRSQLLVAMDATMLNPSDHGKLVFHRYGNKYFLYQVWSSGQSNGFQLPRGHAEKEVIRAANTPAPTTTELALNEPLR